MLNFFYHPLSPFAHKVHYFLEETAIPYKLSVVDLKGGEQTKEPFQKINPLGQVPAIEHNGFGLSESNAILRYLAQRFEKSTWYPTNLEDRAQVDQICEFTNLHLNRWLISLGWNLVVAPKMGMPVDHKAIEDSRGFLLKNMPKLERVLHGKSNLVGATPTLADAVFLPFIAGYRHLDLSMSDYPNVKRWADKAAERPAWKKVQAESERILSGR